MSKCENCYHAKPIDPKEASWRMPGYFENRIYCPIKSRNYDKTKERNVACFLDKEKVMDVPNPCIGD